MSEEEETIILNEEEDGNNDGDEIEVELNEDGENDIRIPEGEEYVPEYAENIPAVDEKLEELKRRYKPQNSGETRLLQDLKSIQEIPFENIGFTAEPYNGMINTWEIKFSKFDKKDSIYPDIQELKKITGKDYILMRISFPPDYPLRPPFLRVVEPRFKYQTGRITLGGSICADVLTLDGWNPTYDVSSLLSNIFAEMFTQNPRLDLTNLTQYTIEEARQAYFRAAANHNWKTTDWLPR